MTEPNYTEQGRPDQPQPTMSELLERIAELEASVNNLTQLANELRVQLAEARR
jgi:hypothetical protein